MINTFIWNIRGVARRASVRRLKKLIRMHSISFRVILESMLDSSQLDAVRIKFEFHLTVCNVVNKIWILWKPEFAVNVLANSEQFIHFAVTHVS